MRAAVTVSVFAYSAEFPLGGYKPPHHCTYTFAHEISVFVGRPSLATHFILLNIFLCVRHWDKLTQGFPCDGLFQIFFVFSSRPRAPCSARCLKKNLGLLEVLRNIELSSFPSVCDQRLSHSLQKNTRITMLMPERTSPAAKWEHD